LGVLLRKQGDLSGAAEAFRQAIKFKHDSAEAYCNLGGVLLDQGRFVEGLEATKRGHALGSKRPDWRFPSAQAVRQAERLVELDAKLQKILSGEVEPADAAERVSLAELCQLPCKGRYAFAARFYAEAFAAQPAFAEDLNVQHRYNAACAAALAGCGQGKDAEQADAAERDRLRRQAREWLHADLAAYRQALDRQPDKIGPVVLQRMQHWQQDGDFAGVRGQEALAKVPEAESQEWRKLWAEVDELRQKVTKPAN
jgi:tetratricopeptide (TPR) repeat protein